MTQNSGASVGYGCYLALASEAEVDEVFAAAVKAGAEPIWPPDNTEWGNYRCRVADPEGFEWTFGTHKPGRPSTDWSEE
jgi:uncharacterized glyoxalase superfamily protein PhnB